LPPVALQEFLAKSPQLLLFVFCELPHPRPTPDRLWLFSRKNLPNPSRHTPQGLRPEGPPQLIAQRRPPCTALVAAAFHENTQCPAGTAVPQQVLHGIEGGSGQGKVAPKAAQHAAAAELRKAMRDGLVEVVKVVENVVMTLDGC